MCAGGEEIECPLTIEHGVFGYFCYSSLLKALQRPGLETLRARGISQVPLRPSIFHDIHYMLYTVYIYYISLTIYNLTLYIV
jgi:hypothetical protein